jgi:transcriptional regulator with XRE-family HTH domain
MPETLASFLREECARRGLSWRAASLGAGLGATSVYGIIHGVSVPEPETLRKLAAYFGVTDQFLMELAGHLTPAPRSGEQDIARALRSHYRDLPPEAVREIEDFIAFIYHKYRREESGG